MRFDGRGSRPAAPFRVCVHHQPRGRWEVVIPGRDEGISCETLEDARRIAYLSVAQGRDCELIVRDAYHRVLERQLIEGRRGQSSGRRRRRTGSFRPANPTTKE